MAYFPNKTQTKIELQERTTKLDLSCTHLTTANFFELNIAYYRENTPREMWKCNQNIWARPVPMQAPVMGEAVLKLKNYYVPYRVVSPQWNDFITKSPHVAYNGSIPFQVTEMPYTTAAEMIAFITNEAISTEITVGTTTTKYDFKTEAGVLLKLTKAGRHAVKILNQLGYQIVMNDKITEHFDMMPLLAFAKVYLDFYTTNQYSQVLEAAYKIEAILKKDETTPYLVTASDLLDIFALTQNVMYPPDYFTSQWDNPTTPNEVVTSLGTIQIPDITTAPRFKAESLENQYNGTPITTANTISQYTIDALKGLTDFVKRLQGSVRNIDRYLARFGVILTNEKMQRSQYNGEQITPMSFGAIYSTAETEQAKVGDYAGQGIINGGKNNEFKYEQLDEFGCILSLFSINPKIGYYQGIDRQHLIRNVESYFNGQFDALGTQATCAAELYVSPNGQSIYGQQAQFDTIFGYLPRNAHHKVGKDRLTGDFVRETINVGAEAWHLFRKIEESAYNQSTNNMVHSPTFVSTNNDANQYNRIFNYQTDEDGDMFNVCLQFAIEANIHGKALYDEYDFEGEGKKIIMDGQGAKQN